VIRKKKEPGSSFLTSLSSLIYRSTDATLEDEEVGNTVLSTPTFFFNLTHQKNVEKLLSKRVEPKTTRCICLN